MINNAERLAEMEDGVIKVQPIAIGESDRRAGQLINLLIQMVPPEDATASDAEEVLLAALWWTHTCASNSKAKQILEEGPTYRIQLLQFGEWTNVATYGPFLDMNEAIDTAKEELDPFNWRVVDKDGDVYARGTNG